MNIFLDKYFKFSLLIIFTLGVNMPVSVFAEILPIVGGVREFKFYRSFYSDDVRNRFTY